MKAAVAEAVDELIAGLPQANVQAEADPEGGAYVRIDEVDIGPAFEPRKTWIAFQITWAYPDADVYPHFIDPGIRYVGQGPAPNQYPEGNLPTSMTRGAETPGSKNPAIQISRRSNKRNAETDTALQKLLRVLDFVRSR